LIGGLIFPGMTFVDIGANIGVYSLHIAHLTDGNANIVAFEPHPRTFAKLRYNCEANRFDNIACINSGVGPSEGETILFSDGGGNIGGASMLREASGDAVSDTVRTTRLDAQLRSRGVSSVDLLKIDIEGYEDRALMPFFSMAGNSGLFPNAILLETVHRRLWQNDLLNHLAGLGYRVIAQTEENVLLKRQIAA
jgi:FkbM family methyltransferase